MVWLRNIFKGGDDSRNRLFPDYIEHARRIEISRSRCGKHVSNPKSKSMANSEEGQFPCSFTFYFFRSQDRNFDINHRCSYWRVGWLEGRTWLFDVTFKLTNADCARLRCYRLSHCYGTRTPGDNDFLGKDSYALENLNIISLSNH